MVLPLSPFYRSENQGQLVQSTLEVEQGGDSPEADSDKTLAWI